MSNSTFGKFIRRARRPVFAWLSRVGVFIVLALYLLLSLYVVWGWVTLSDIRKYCERKGLDFESVLDGMVADTSVRMGLTAEGKSEMEVKITHTDEPIYKWVVPFAVAGNRGDRNKPGEGDQMWIQGGLLEPIMVLSENTANCVFSLGIGTLISLVIIMTEKLRNKSVTGMRLIVRPIVGALGALCTYLIILSGGSIIWNQVAGVSGLSLGVISAIGAIYVEKLPKYATFTT